MVTADEFNLALIAALIVGMVVIGGIVWLLFRSGTLPHPGAIITSLTILSLVALVLGVLEGSEAAIAIAGTGVGALAGAVASTFTDKGGSDDDTTR